MKRRKVTRLLLLGGAAVLASPFLYIAGKRGYKLLSDPSLSFLQENKILLEELAEVIIPTTDTPGAKEANVGKFIITMLRDCTSKISQQNFIEGLADLIEYAESNFGKPFTQCTEHEKIDTLNHFEKEGQPYKGLVGKVERKLLGDSFFTTLKKYTVIGFCTSEPGATKSFVLDYIPGKYIGIVSLLPGQKAWATQ